MTFFYMNVVGLPTQKGANNSYSQGSELLQFLLTREQTLSKSKKRKYRMSYNVFEYHTSSATHKHTTAKPFGLFMSRKKVGKKYVSIM